FHIGANAGQDITLEIGNMSAEKLGVQGKVYEATDVSGVTGLEVASTTGKALTVKIAAAKGSNSAAITETKAELNTAGTEINITLKQDAGATNTAGAVTATNDEIKAALEKIAGDAGIKVSTKDTFNGAGAATGAAGKNTTVSIVKKSGIDVSSQKAASTAITTINSAIEKVSAERSKLGAYQNRLEHTIANLDNSSENLQAAESRVRDVDMAKEMMNFSKSNILQQAAQAMLAQANQAPQGVLQLLR
ncbi:flagellin, partial [Coprococcus sp. MSK.21.13]|nr:flagellin [Coprococcus sp. MSK.21.13]